MFGHSRHKAEDELGDAALIRAARQRLLAELSTPQHAAAQRVVNNLYAGGGGGGGGGGYSGGVMDHLGGGAAGPAAGEDPYDYLVDISRRNVTDPNGELVGWDKTVHRHREKKK